MSAAIFVCLWMLELQKGSERSRRISDGAALAMTASVYRKIIASPGAFGFVRPCREAPAAPFEQVQYRDEP
jgi:hypothetical protein